MELSHSDRRPGFQIGTLSKLSDLECLYPFDKEAAPRKILAGVLNIFPRCFSNSFETLCHNSTNLCDWKPSCIELTRTFSKCIRTSLEPTSMEYVEMISYERDVRNVLCYRLDILEYYINTKPSNKTRFLLYLFLDEHIDLYNECCKGLVNDIGKLRSLFPSPSRVGFWGNSINTMPFIKESGFWNLAHLKRHPLVHLFTKSLPHRCQNRNMQTLTIKYIKENIVLQRLFESILQTSVLGNYMNSQPLHFFYRCHVYRQKNDSDFWLMMMNKHFPVTLHALKEHIIFAVEQIPSLSKTLVQKQRWVEFKDGIKRILKPVRTLLSTYEEAASDTEDLLFIMNKTSKYNLGRHIHHHTTAFHTHETRFKSTMRKIHGVLNDQVGFSFKHFMLLYNIACRFSFSNFHIPWYILSAFGVPRKTIQNLYHIKKGKFDIACANRHKVIIYTFLEAMSLRFGIQYYILPGCIWEQQRKTVIRIHGLKKDASDSEVRGKCMPFILCSRCRTFKGFLNFISSKGKIVRGYGNKDVLIDDYTEALYCANHKNLKNQVKKTSNSIISQLQNENSNMKKSRSRTSKYLLCEQTPLLRFPSYGVCLSFFGSIYMLCPMCIGACKYSTMVFSRGKLMCSPCSELNRQS